MTTHNNNCCTAPLTHTSKNVLYFVLLLVVLTGIGFVGYYFGFLGFIYKVMMPEAFGKFSLVVLSIIFGTAAFFSPCTFTVLPAYVSHHLTGGAQEPRRSVARGLYFGLVAALGVIVVDVAVGLVIAALGAAAPFAKDPRQDIPLILGVRVVTGLLIVLMGVLAIKGTTFHVPVVERLLGKLSFKKSVFFYGVLYNGAALGCTGPILLGLILYALTTGSFTSAFLAFVLFALTMGLLMVVLTTLIGAFTSAFAKKLMPLTHVIKKFAGVVMIVVGLSIVLLTLEGNRLFVKIFFPFLNGEVKQSMSVKHSVPLEEILSGGPPKDGIPSIDNPKFVSVEEAGAWLQDDEPGIAFSHGTTNRFYPYQILVWHEIVNDIVDGERVLATYCPLCLTGYVFDPLVKGERVEFGTSGKLWKSNLVMYDRQTDSLWSQILGKAIVGEMTGVKLALLPSDQMFFGEWKKAFAQGQVLSRETGAQRFYGSSPYGDYFTSVGFARSLAGGRDERLPPDSFVFGLVVNGKAKAYHVETVKQKGEVVDQFEGQTFVLRHDKSVDVVRVFKRLPDGGEERVNPFSAFWFAWTAAHPETELYK